MLVETQAKLRVTRPGVATGMAWTQVGGELLFIEATQMPGSGRLILTGKLGEVMRESCQASLSWLKSNVGTIFASYFKDASSSEAGGRKHGQHHRDRALAAGAVVTKIAHEQIFKSMDLHVHFPAGVCLFVLSVVPF